MCSLVSSNLETAAALKQKAGCLWRCDFFLVLKLVFGLICPLTVSFNVGGSSSQKISGPIYINICKKNYNIKNLQSLSNIKWNTYLDVRYAQFYPTRNYDIHQFFPLIWTRWFMLGGWMKKRNLCWCYTYSRMFKEVKGNIWIIIWYFLINVF